MYPDNILLWPDGFWCFRDELRPDFMRDENYKVVLHHSDQWQMLQHSNPMVPPK